MMRLLSIAAGSAIAQVCRTKERGLFLADVSRFKERRVCAYPRNPCGTPLTVIGNYQTIEHNFEPNTRRVGGW